MADELKAQGRDYRDKGAKWLERIKAAQKLEEEWFKQAEAAEAAYLCNPRGDQRQWDFNILHSNVETIVPAIINSSPIPDIRERFRKGREDEPARIASQVIERAIQVQIDDSRLDEEIEAGAQDAFVAGRDIVRVRFDADTTEEPVMAPVVDPMTGQPAMDPQTGQPAMQPAMGADGKPMMQPVVSNERVGYEVVSWRDAVHGPSRRWGNVPWWAFRHYIPHEEVQEMQDGEVKEALLASGDDKDCLPEEGEADSHIWEIWDKAGRKVCMISGGGVYLKEMDDPMGLQGFFPIGNPVMPISGTNSLTPVCPFEVYRKQAEELDTIQKRISRLVKVLKAVGLVAGEASALEDLASADDGTLIPLGNIEGFSVMGGLDKAVMWWPVEQIAKVLAGLYEARDQVKAQIYEITGISDIIRGQGEASETATAQEIKTQWGSLRIRKLQRLIERQVRSLFVLTAELVCSKFSPETLQKMTGIEITPEVAQLLTAPLDHYRIDVESDSTVRADLSRHKTEMAEFLRGAGEYFAVMAPVVAQDKSALAPMVEIFASFARYFNLGKQAEDALEMFSEQARQKAQQPEGPSPEEQQLEQQRAQFEQQMMLEMEKLKAEIDKIQADTALAQQELVLDERKAEIDGIKAIAEIELGQDEQPQETVQ